MFNEHLYCKYFSIHYFDEKLSFPVMLLAKNKQESELILNNLTKDIILNFNLANYIDWSKNHCIDYHVLTPDFPATPINAPLDLIRLQAYKSLFDH